MLPIYASHLGAEGYGIVDMINVVVSALTVFVGYGITGAMNRFYYEKETDFEKKTLVSTTLILMFCLVLICSLPFLLFSKELSYLAFGKSGLELYLIIGIVSFIFDMASSSASGYIFIKQKSQFFTIISTLKLVVGLSLNIQFIVIQKMGVLGVLYSGLISAILFFLVVQTYAFRDVGFRFSMDQSKVILKYSIPLIPGYIAMFLRSNADRVILGKSLGLGELGVYSMLLTFSSLVSVFLLTPFFNVWNNKRFEICQQPDGAAIMAKVFTSHLVIMFLFGLILALQIPLLLGIMTPKEFWVPGEYAYLAVVSVIMFASYYHVQFGMSYAKVTMKMSMVQIYTAIVSVVLNLILIQYIGILGALIATLFVYTFQSALSYYLSKKYFQIPFEWGKIAKIVISATVMFMLCNSVTLVNTEFGMLLREQLAPALTSTFSALHLNELKDGKLLAFVLGNFSLVVDGIVKLLLSFLYVPVLLFLGILSKDQILKPLQAIKMFKNKQALV